MVYGIIKEEQIPSIEGRRIGNKKYLFKDVSLKLTEKEIIFTQKGRSCRYTIRLTGITKLGLLQEEKDKAIRYKIQINDFEFYGDQKWFHLTKEKINDKALIVTKVQ